MPASQVANNDVLPDGFGDPMLMSIEDIETHIASFKSAENEPAVYFLRGVLFARLSLIAAGVLRD